MADEELFERIRDHNDTDAFRALYRRYSSRLFSYCLRQLGHRPTAEEAFQFVISQIWEKRETFRGGQFAAWLFTIARHHCIRLGKRSAQLRKTVVAIEDVEQSYFADDDRSSEDVLRNSLLQQSIAELPDDYKQAIELRYFAGLTYEEMAATLEIGVSLAKIRVHRAKKLLHERLSPMMSTER